MALVKKNGLIYRNSFLYKNYLKFSILNLKFKSRGKKLVWYINMLKLSRELLIKLL